MAASTRVGLFERGASGRSRGGCTDLVPLDLWSCANCGNSLVVVEAAQSALFYGGYGETKHGLVRYCVECGWVGGSAQRSTNPRYDTFAPDRRASWVA